MSSTHERLYLDSCIVNRPADDQRQRRIREEVDAISIIMNLSQSGVVHWITSDHLWAELSRNPNPVQREYSLLLAGYANEFVRTADATYQRAIHFRTDGFGEFDALHLAIAEQAKAASLLTVDDRFIRRAQRRTDLLVTVENPVSWLRRRQTWLLKP